MFTSSLRLVAVEPASAAVSVRSAQRADATAVGKSLGVLGEVRPKELLAEGVRECSSEGVESSVMYKAE